MDWSKRSEELELIDQGSAYYTEAEYHACLHQLDRVGKYLGGDRATFKAIEKLPYTPESILDVGCGGGGFTRKIGLRYPNARIDGIDISEEAILYAQKSPQRTHVTFRQQNLQHIPSKSYDLVVTTLVCHHLDDAALLLFLKECIRVAKKAVIINDLHRHPIAWGLFLLSAPILFRNRLITHDGALSIKKAFTYSDWKRYLSKVGVGECKKSKISWHFPFRWLITLEIT